MITKSLNNNHKIILFDIDYTFFDTAKFKQSNLTHFRVYKEVEATFSALKQIAVLGIFSEGDNFLQRKKLRKTAAEKYFEDEHVHIVKRKGDIIGTLVNKYKGAGRIYLVDDKLTILYTAKNIMPSLYCIWMKRGEYAEKQKPIDEFNPDAVIESLEEIIPIIKNM